MRRSLFPIIALLGLSFLLGSCASVNDGRASGGGESSGWRAFASSVKGQNPAEDEDDVPVIVWDAPAPNRQPTPLPESKPEPKPEPMPEVLRPAPVRPLPPPVVRVEDDDPPLDFPVVDMGDDNAALAYDMLKRSARQPKSSRRFVPTVKRMSDGVEGLTRYYSRLLMKLNPGF